MYSYGLWSIVGNFRPSIVQRWDYLKQNRLYYILFLRKFLGHQLKQLVVLLVSDNSVFENEIDHANFQLVQILKLLLVQLVN